MVQAQAATAARLKSLEVTALTHPLVYAQSADVYLRSVALQDLQVSSSYTSELPGDEETENRLRQARSLHVACTYSACEFTLTTSETCWLLAHVQTEAAG